MGMVPTGAKRQNSGAYASVSVWSALLTFTAPQHRLTGGGTPMITIDAPAWLRRSDQAVTWARTMLQPAAPSSSTARQQICQAALLATTVIRTCGIARERNCSADGKPHDSGTLSLEQDLSGQETVSG